MNGLELIMLERYKQVNMLGYTVENDRAQYLNKHSAPPNQLFLAAEAYLYSDVSIWPWSTDYWKPKSELHNLIKAGALYLAHFEITGDKVALIKMSKTVKRINKLNKL